MLDHLLAILLLVVVPARALWRSQTNHPSSEPKTTRYLTTIGTVGGLLSLLAIDWIAAGRAATALGLGVPTTTPALIGLCIAAALLADPRVAWIEDVIRFGDTDMNGHVNNATFAVLAESGRVGLFRTELGFSPGPTYFVIARLVIEFRAELHYPGRVQTGTWLTSLGRSSMGIGQVILAADGTLAATSEAVCVQMDATTRRPAPFAPELRARAEGLVRAAR